MSSLSFKKSQLFVMWLALVCIFLVYIYYNNFQRSSYPQGQELFPQTDFRGDNDTVSKLENIYNNETEQNVKLLDKPGDVNESNSSQKDNNNNNNQHKANSKPDQLNQNQTVPGMNATHINGILMEPVDAKYTRNIYFTIKTTHKFYTGRLFPIMLTWLQLVDKNKVSCYL